jgi:hypothetical protein
VLSIYPHSISRPAGWINHYEQIRKELAIALQGGMDASGQLGPLSPEARALATASKRVEKTKDYSFQYHVVIANASGTGNRAMEFYQEEGMAAIGQFNLEIFFRIQSKAKIYVICFKESPALQMKSLEIYIV